MNERSKLISKLRTNLNSRTAYIKSKLGVLVPSQIRALRLQSEMPRQSDLAKAANLHQSRISMFETPGAANMTLETLAKMAAAFRVGLVVKFVPYSEMLRWETAYSQDSFHVTPIEDDVEFERPAGSTALNYMSGQNMGSQKMIPLMDLMNPEACRKSLLEPSDRPKEQNIATLKKHPANVQEIGVNIGRAIPQSVSKKEAAIS